jgi:protein-S-isoprenylcysteine O-methyltransferase Ste14
MKQEAKDNILMVILGITFFLNIIVMNLFPPTIKELVVAGYIILGIGALLFILSVFTLRIKGTSNVVDSGIYGIVRHPMYLGAIVMFFSHIFLGQNWIVTISTIIAIVCCYLIIQLGDQRNIERFGEDYKLYMQKVPRANFLLGIIRLLGRRKSEHDR